MKREFLVSVWLIIANLNAQTDTVFVPYLGQIDLQWTSQLKKTEDGFHYQYQIHCLESSKQDIWAIRVQLQGNCMIRHDAPLNWFSFRSDSNRYAGGRSYIGWGPDDFDRFIWAGTRMEGFQIITDGLPFIADYHVSSYFPPPHIEFGEEEPVIIGSMNMYENSKKGKTIGPACPPSPFFPAAFLDTLVSYTRQSGGLGWIADQQTSEKYETHFHSAQTSLQEDRLDDTRQTLYQVLQEAQTDSGAALTSEAYALLCYNTVYLLSQLQESEVSLDDLIAYIRQAFEEGKITNKGIANSLIAKLETAGKHLEKGKPKQAVNVLNAFLNELEAQYEKHIAGEVYDYLKENVTALITRLGSPE